MKNFTLLILLLFSSIVWSQVYLNQNVSGGNNDGTSWNNAFNDLNNALNAATPNTEIWVAQGTYKPIDQTTPFLPPTGVKLYGGFNGTETLVTERSFATNPTILSGDLNSDSIRNSGDVHTLIMLTNNDVEINGFTIEYSYADDNSYIAGRTAGAIWNGANNTKISNCIFKEHYANISAGAIYHESGTNARYTNCLFYNNFAIVRGGVIIAENGDASFINCTAYNNTAGSQPAAFDYFNADLTLTNCIVYGNGNTDNFLNVGGSGTLSTSYSFIEGENTGLNNNIDGTLAPFFVNTLAGSEDFNLTFNSPCIDVGNNTVNTESYSLNGDARIQNATIDLGAYEGEVVLASQNVHYNLNNNLNDQLSSYSGTYIVNGVDTNITNATFVNNDSGIQLASNQGVKLPVELPQQTVAGSSFEMELEFTYTNDNNGGGQKPIVSFKQSKVWNSAGFTFFTETAGAAPGNFQLFLLYADGQNATQGAQYSYNIKVGDFAIGTPIKLNFFLDYDLKVWTVLLNNQYSVGYFEDNFNMSSFKSAILSSPSYLGWIIGHESDTSNNPTHFSGEIVIDEFLMFPGRKPTSISTLTTALSQMTDHILGNIILNQTEIDDYTTEILTNYHLNYSVAKTDIDAYLLAFENNYPPLFSSRNQVDVSTLSGQERIALFLQQDIHDTAFVSGNIDNVVGTKFEAAEAYPGAVDPTAPRVTNAQVAINGSYVTDPGYYLQKEHLGVIRPTGYYAAPGELVTITVPASAVNSGIEIIVGAHTRDLTNKMHSINRFPRISKAFNVTTQSIKIANPFGGGIYLKIPKGLNIGSININIDGAVKSPYFKYVNNQAADIVQWQTDLSNAHVKWVDVESDKMMFTIPLSTIDGNDPNDLTQILDTWNTMWDAVSTAAGRPLAKNRAEYLLVDSRPPFNTNSSGYPLIVADKNVDNVNAESWWNPLKVVDGNFLDTNSDGLLFHEFGHNMGFPTVRGELESVIQLVGVPMLNVGLGLDIDTAVSSVEAEAHTRDLAAMNWMISDNFRNNNPMGCDPTMDPNGCSEFSYQIRGGGKYFDIAGLYGWNGLGDIHKVFYDLWTQNGGQEPNDSWITRAEFIQAATEATGENLTSLLHFWGYIPEEPQRIALETYPQSDVFYQRLLYYKNLIPVNQAEFATWRDTLKATVSSNHHARIDAVYNDYDSQDIGGQIHAQIDLLIDMYFKDALISPKVFLQGAALNPNTGEENFMRDDLRVATLIPTTSPYTDGLVANNTVFNTGGTSGTGAINDDIVDWIWVELRDKADNTLIKLGQSALLQRDGDIVDLDGISDLKMRIAPNDYYVAIKHRNHLGIMNTNTISLTDTATTPLDFTDATNQITYGTNAQTTFRVSSGVVAMWAGNVNGDKQMRYQGSPNANDTNSLRDIVLSENGNMSNSNLHLFNAYSNADINLDSQIRYQGSVNDSDILKDIVIKHPLNIISKSNLYTIQEQLPEN